MTISKIGVKQHKKVAAVIADCLNLTQPKSFFLYAGAGSGKTRSLVEALVDFLDRAGSGFRLRGQVLPVITYTNAASEEIQRRLNFDPIIQVSTIHSFVWQLIDGFNEDIRAYLTTSLKSELEELQIRIAKGRPGTKVMFERQRELLSKTDRLNGLGSIKSFKYSPVGDNRARDQLSHSEVIKIGSAFIRSNALFRNILVSGSPFILIDESQDTNRELIEALIGLQQDRPDRFAIGLFGDMMQRIFPDGKADLGENLPKDWRRPEKTVNFRCSKRIVRLINKIRLSTDKWQQHPAEDASEGHAKLFIVEAPVTEKREIEQLIREKMALITEDQNWKEVNKIKTLILEHLMAARRMGFFELFDSLGRVSEFGTALRTGAIGFVQFFFDQVYCVVAAHQRHDEFAVARIATKFSPLLTEDAFRNAVRQQDQLLAAREGIVALSTLCDPQNAPTFQQVLDLVAKTRIFEIPESLYPYVETDGTVEPEAEVDTRNSRETGIRRFLKVPFFQIVPYVEYVSGLSPFGTHQGVKGLEFPRVMVLMDDDEASGFLFSYDKLFGAKESTQSDLENEASGNETSVDRTRRLLYVTCSRSEYSLALVAYTRNPVALKKTVIKREWFDESEVELL